MVLKEKRSIIFIGVVLLIFLGTRYLMMPQQSNDQEDVYTFPITIGKWHGHDMPFDRELLSSWLGTNYIVFRRYDNDSGGGMISVYIAYYQDMKASDLAHAPEVCYPGQGWKILSNQGININLLGRDIKVKRMYIERNMEHEVVYSWWQTREKIIPSNSLYRLHQVINKISQRGTASIWVRVSGESSGAGIQGNAGEGMVLEFCNEALPLLTNYFQSRG